MAEIVQDGSVVGARTLSPSVRELVLTPRERPITFAPGQWISLRLPVGPRPPLIRAYTMAEPQSESGRLVLVFDRVPQGLGSTYLFNVEPGETVPFSGPYGKFVLPQPVSTELLFVARFTGIVAFRCMIRQLAQTGALPKMTLLYVAPSSHELIYDEEFRQLAGAHPQFRYRSFIEAGEGLGERMAGALRSELQRRGDLFSMVAGTKGFVRPVRNVLAELGVDRRAVRHETYD